MVLDDVAADSVAARADETKSKRAVPGRRMSTPGCGSGGTWRATVTWKTLGKLFENRGEGRLLYVKQARVHKPQAALPAGLPWVALLRGDHRAVQAALHAADDR